MHHRTVVAAAVVVTSDVGTTSGVTNAAALAMAVGSVVSTIAVDGVASLQACNNRVIIINSMGMIFLILFPLFLRCSASIYH